MKKPNYNDTISKLMTVEQAKQRYKLSRATLMRIAEDAGAVRRIGRIVRLEAEIMDETIDKL